MSNEASCKLQEDFLLSPTLADRLEKTMEEWETQTMIGIRVISGYRTEKQQDDLRRRGRPTAPPGTSTHTTCPSTGADIRITGFVTNKMKWRFGTIVRMNGLRWGGGSRPNPETLIPEDWNHVDLGPRGQ